jgi:membrane protein implicated in regulation of membrane protease activity
MLTAGAALVEGFAVWLFLGGAPLWLVGVAAAVGCVLLLLVDRAFDRDGPPAG